MIRRAAGETSEVRSEKTLASLLEIEDLSVSFRTPGGVVQAVDKVSYSVSESEIVAVVGNLLDELGRQLRRRRQDPVQLFA